MSRQHLEVRKILESWTLALSKANNGVAKDMLDLHPEARCHGGTPATEFSSFKGWDHEKIWGVFSNSHKDAERIWKSASDYMLIAINMDLFLLSYFFGLLYIYIPICIYIYIYTHTHTHIYTYIYIHILTHTHTHIYIYIHHPYEYASNHQTVGIDMCFFLVVTLYGYMYMEIWTPAESSTG